MKTDMIHALTDTFEAHAQQTEAGVEFWLARDLQYLLGYAEWRNFFTTAISRAKAACEFSGQAAADHFVDVNKTIAMPKGIDLETALDAREAAMRLPDEVESADAALDDEAPPNDGDIDSEAVARVLIEIMSPV